MKQLHQFRLTIFETVSFNPPLKDALEPFFVYDRKTGNLLV